METGATYVLSENEGQDGGSQLRQEDEEDEHEKLQDKKTKRNTVSAKQSERPRQAARVSEKVHVSHENSHSACARLALCINYA